VESVPGGFSAIYPVLKRWKSRAASAAATSWPVSVATQFGIRPLLDLLRSYRGRA